MNTNNICTLSVVLLLSVIPCQIQAQTNTFPSSGNVGIGTTNPGRKLDVKGNLALDNYAIYSKGGSTISFGNTGIAIANEDDDIGINIVNNGELEITHNDTNALSISINEVLLGREGNMNIGIGTNNPTKKLTVAGTAKAEEVIVEENVGADFVFEENYNLPSLSEVEQHIKSHKHLPEIPSAEAMKRNGVKVGDLQMKLLQKIEELTLYVIEQDRKIKRLEKENRSIKKHLDNE